METGSPDVVVFGFKLSFEQAANVFDRLCQQWPTGHCSKIRTSTADMLACIKTVNILNTGCRSWSHDYGYNHTFKIVFATTARTGGKTILKV